MESALKQRLIGAIVLVALAVIFLPMLIKGPAPDSGVSDVALNVPAAPSAGYETRELPLTPPGDAPSGGALGMEAGRLPAETTGGVAAAPQAGTVDDARPTPIPGAAAGNYAVGFGAYASTADADAVIARLAQSRLQAYQEPATINGRSVYRVRIGPYADRADAESARLQAVRIRNDVNAQVLVLDAQPAAAAASVPAASTPVAAASAQPPAAAPLPPVSPAATAATSAKPPSKPPVAEPAPAPAPAQKTAASAPPKAAPAAVAATPSPAPAASSVGFAVQLGAFAKEADANALRDRVRGGGFSAFVEPVRTDKGNLSRVRVGPVASRAEAERLRSQVASKFGINGMIRPHP